MLKIYFKSIKAQCHGCHCLNLLSNSEVFCHFCFNMLLSYCNLSESKSNFGACATPSQTEPLHKLKSQKELLKMFYLFWFFSFFQLGMSQPNAQYAWESWGVCKCCTAAGNSPWELRALSFPLLTLGKGEYPKQEGSVLWEECSCNPGHHWTPEELKLHRNSNVNTATARQLTHQLGSSRANTQGLTQPTTEGVTGACHLK